MSNELTIKAEQASSVIEEIVQAFYDIPFDNSGFQTEHFVIGQNITPERAYRGIGLRLLNRLQALQTYQIEYELELLDVAELEEKLKDPNITSIQRRRTELEIQKKTVGRSYTNKLVNDALHEVNILYKHFNALPKYTREEFEAGEERHFRERNYRQLVGLNPGHDALLNMYDDANAIYKFQEEFAKLPASMREKIPELTDKVMTNLFNKRDNTQLDIRKTNPLLKG